MDNGRNDKDYHGSACMYFYIVNKPVNERNVVVHINRTLGVHTAESFT